MIYNNLIERMAMFLIWVVAQELGYVDRIRFSGIYFLVDLIIQFMFHELAS